jgi:hypothetical protein
LDGNISFLFFIVHAIVAVTMGAALAVANIQQKSQKHVASGLI